MVRAGFRRAVLYPETNQETQMRRAFFVASAAAVLLASFGIASQLSTIVTPAYGEDAHHGEFRFSPEHGHVIRQHAEHEHYRSHDDHHVHADVGLTLPGSVELHPLPHALMTQIPSAHEYRYGIVNGRHVIVHHSTRRVMHAF
jgi:hypothetical protein